MLAAVDAAMTDLMRAVLHDPAFQHVEAAWRGVQWLVSTLDLGETLELHLLHVTRDELAAGAAQGGDLWRRLVERESRPEGGLELSALIGNFQFGPSADDLAALEQMGAMAAAMGTPFIAGASPSLLGATSLALQPQPRDWSPLAREDETRWQALRAHAAAAHVGLALPRFLLRLPYGQNTDPIAAFSFEEQPVPPRTRVIPLGQPGTRVRGRRGSGARPRGRPLPAGSIEDCRRSSTRPTRAQPAAAGGDRLERSRGRGHPGARLDASHRLQGPRRYPAADAAADSLVARVVRV